MPLIDKPQAFFPEIVMTKLQIPPVKKHQKKLIDTDYRLKFLVSEETVVLRLKHEKRVDKGRITTVKDLESWRFQL